MQIPGQIFDLQAAGGKFLQRELKEGGIVGFEVDFPVFPNYMTVFFQEGSIGQPALGVFLPGPGVREIDEQPVDFPGCENVFHVSNVHVDEKHIVKAHSLSLLHGHHHGLPAPLHGNQQHLRVCLGGFGGEFSLAAADLHPQLPTAGLQFPPGSLVSGRFPDPVGPALFRPGLQIAHSSHSHIYFLQKASL